MILTHPPTCCLPLLACRPQYSSASPFPFHTFSVCFCLPLLCLTLQSWHPYGPAFNYLSLCTSKVISSKPLTSVPTLIHGSITYVIIIVYDIYGAITTICQALCSLIHLLRLIQSTPNIHWIITILIFNEEVYAQKVSKSCPVSQN